MKILLLLGIIISTNFCYSQDNVEFSELEYGRATIATRDPVPAESLPTGNRNMANNLEFIERTDSIQMVPRATFGILYMLKATDSVDINVDVEWVFPKKMVDNKGKKYKSIRYTTVKPTNTELGNTYTFDEPYELIEGRWTLNLYVNNKKLHSRTFVVYK